MLLCVEKLCLEQEGFGNYAGWRDPKRGKEKRGGLRIIYYYLMSDHQVWFVTIYNKDEMIDLSAEEKDILKRMIQAELVARRKT